MEPARLADCHRILRAFSRARIPILAMALTYYYFLTLLLQILPYSLTGGAGVLLGLAYFRRRPYYQDPKWVGILREAVWDVLRIYLVATPIFLGALLWEFLAR